MIEFNNTYALLSGISVCIIILLGIMLWFAPVAQELKSKNYRTSRLLMGSAYLLLGVVRIATQTLFSSMPVVPPPTFTFLISATTQVALLLPAIVILLNPQTLKLNRIAILIAPALVAMVLLSGSLTFFSAGVYRYLFVFCMALYIFQLTYAFSLFMIAYKKSSDALGAEHDTVDLTRLGNIKTMFFTWIGAGAVAFVTLFITRSELVMFFIGIFTLFYIYMAMQFLGYSYRKIKKA